MTYSSVGTRDDFNNMDRARSFDNVDLSALVRYTPNANIDTDLGLSRTARAPNLYELYSWSRNGMALEMNNFVGDGNGYLGNPYLKSEIANKVSANFDWHSREPRDRNSLLALLLVCGGLYRRRAVELAGPRILRRRSPNSPTNS